MRQPAFSLGTVPHKTLQDLYSCLKAVWGSVARRLVRKTWSRTGESRNWPSRIACVFGWLLLEVGGLEEEGTQCENFVKRMKQEWKGEVWLSGTCDGGSLAVKEHVSSI